MNGSRNARIAYCGVLAIGLVLTLVANLPGHMSVDSVITLYEGRTAIRQTWAPPFNGWVLGRFATLLPGTSLYVATSAAGLYFSLMTLPWLRPRTSWLAVPLAAAAVLTPHLLIYQGIVWKDVLFANLTVAGFIFLAHAARLRGRVMVAPALVLALFCLTASALVRQNGLIVVAVALAVLAWPAGRPSPRRVLAWGLGGLVVTVALAVTLQTIATPKYSVAKLRPHATSRILQHYDIIGAKAHDPALRLDKLIAADPIGAALIAADGPAAYSAARVEALEGAPAVMKRLWRMPDDAVAAQWRDVVTHHPGAYLAHRLDVFRWVVLTPGLQRCLPIHVGVDGPADQLAFLAIPRGEPVRDRALAAYAQRFYGGPVYSHLTYMILAGVMAGVLLLRREPQDLVMVALAVAALGFAASFFVISVACDYRYLYVLDLAAITGLLYVALDPPFRRKAIAAPAPPG